MLNYDLVDFYASREFKTVMAKYQLLTELITNESITFCDNENLLENKNTLKSKSWIYIATPLHNGFRITPNNKTIMKKPCLAILKTRN